MNIFCSFMQIFCSQFFFTLFGTIFVRTHFLFRLKKILFQTFFVPFGTFLFLLLLFFCSKLNKKCAFVAHCGIELPWLPCIASCGLAWPCVALYGLFMAMTMYGLIRISKAFCVLVWPCMAFLWLFYGLKLHFMVFYGRILYFLAVIDPNSFGLILDYYKQ